MVTVPLNFWIGATSQPGVRFPKIRSMVGKVTIENQNAHIGIRLAEGEKVSTDSMNSMVRLVYDDGTSVVLAGNSTVVFDHENNQKKVLIKRGNISASIAPQSPGKPLLIISDSAVMEVLGTDLAISTNSKTTRLDVTEGKVKIRERSQGSEAEIAAGNYAVARFGKEIQIEQQRTVPDTWNIDFDEGLPQGWELGTWERMSLGNGLSGKTSLGAVRQVLSPINGYYSITSNNAWSEGLFRIHEDTFLHYRVKMDRPEWYQVLLVTRDGEFRYSDMQGTYEYQEMGSHTNAIRNLAPNTWRTIHVPLSGFKRSDVKKYSPAGTPFEERPVDPPSIGNVVYHMIFGTQHEDRGLVIDDITVTVGRP